MTEEDEAFEDLAKRQGDWGMQGSRKHQILRYAENVESKGTSMTQDEIEYMWKVASNNPNHDTNWHDPVVEAFAKLVAQKAFADGYEKGVAVFMLAVDPEYASEVTKLAALAIRARGQA